MAGSGSDAGSLFVFRNNDQQELQNRHFRASGRVLRALSLKPSLNLFGHDICHAEFVMNGTGASAATPR